MDSTVEILITGRESIIGDAVLRAMAQVVGRLARVTDRYKGGSYWLVMYGAGEASRDLARNKHIAAGGRVICWDIGYFGQGKNPRTSYVRVSIDHNHPWRLMSETPNDPGRWIEQDRPLREDADSTGNIYVIGMGAKSRVHLKVSDWEIRTLKQTMRRFQDRQVVYRPKPCKRPDGVMWVRDERPNITEVLRGASLVVCAHSNVAVDACIAGVPVECTDGAALWLYRNGPNPSPAERFDFLCRLAHWQYKISELEQAWQFLQKVCV